MRLLALSMSVVAVSALNLSCKTSDIKEQESTVEAAQQSGDMEYVKVCDRQNVCKKFSRLIMGTDHLVQGDWVRDGQPEISEEQMFAVLDEAVRLGINFFDTAPIYVGGVENKLGKWLKSRKGLVASDKTYNDRRSNPDRKVYLLSKGGFPFDLYYSKKLESGTHSEQLKAELRKLGILNANSKPQGDGSLALKNVPPGTYASRLFGSEEQIKNRVAEELRHTETNFFGDLTVYLMHRDDGDYIKFNEVKRTQTPVKTIMSALSSKEIADKYWALGWSNWETDRVNESIRLGAQNADLVKPSFNSAYFSLFEMSARTIHAGGVQVTHKEMMSPNFQRRIFQNPYSPLGGFSIFDKPEPIWENAKKSAKQKYDAGDAYWQNVYPAVFTVANEARFKRVDEFTKSFNTKNKTNYTIDQMINAYALAHKRMDFLTVGPVTIEQLRRTVGALKLAKLLTPKDLEYLYAGK